MTAAARACVTMQELVARALAAAETNLTGKLASMDAGKQTNRVGRPREPLPDDVSTLRSALASRIRSLRLAAGLSSAALAARAGVATSTVIRLEAGQSGAIESIAAVAGALGLTPAELMAAVPAWTSSRQAGRK